MGLTPMCPKCGSVKTSRVGKSDSLQCDEPDCGHQESRQAFMTGGPAPTHQTYRKKLNQKWRDPVASSSDGYAGSPENTPDVV